MPGVLEGIRIIEMAGIGPTPFCGMMLADHGAEVIRVERVDGGGAGIEGAVGENILHRSRRTIAVDLKQTEGVAVVRRLTASADALIEGFRPGVMERLGLGSDVLIGENARLVYGRMTGWGQAGPYAKVAGHDINYIALTGNLDTYGRAGGPPTPPINAVGDFGGGGMMLAFGVLAGIVSARATGCGQVIDCAMTDGAALLAAMVWGLRANGVWHDQRGTNLLDTGAPFYDTFQTADGLYISIGSIEPSFYQLLREKLGFVGDPAFDAQLDEAVWPELKRRIAARIAEKTRDEWCAIMEGTDVCFAPVLSMAEAPSHPHNIARGTFLPLDGDHVQPAPAPRFSATPAQLPADPRPAMSALMDQLGYSSDEIAALKEKGVIS